MKEKTLKKVVTTTLFLILLLNVVVGVRFNGLESVPSITLIDLGMQAFAQSETYCAVRPLNVVCEAGGAGASHCSIETTLIGGIAKKFEVTCDAVTGCYACCWGESIIRSGGAQCFGYN